MVSSIRCYEQDSSALFSVHERNPKFGYLSDDFCEYNLREKEINMK